jgi:hypothetical protein
MVSYAGENPGVIHSPWVFAYLALALPCRDDGRTQLIECEYGHHAVGGAPYTLAFERDRQRFARPAVACRPDIRQDPRRMPLSHRADNWAWSFPSLTFRHGRMRSGIAVQGDCLWDALLAVDRFVEKRPGARDVKPVLSREYNSRCLAGNLRCRPRRSPVD